MGVLRVFDNEEWVTFGDCPCTGAVCECSEFLVHRMGPSEFKALAKKHTVKRKEKWPDGWREVSETTDAFAQAIACSRTV